MKLSKIQGAIVIMWAFTLLIMAALDLFMGWRAGQYDHQILACAWDFCQTHHHGLRILAFTIIMGACFYHSRGKPKPN